MEQTTFLSVSLRNYKSYGNNKTTVFFDRPGTSFIIGENLDYTEQGVSGNGVGKTTIMDAMTYACYDKPLDPSIKLDELVNSINEKHMEVEVIFRKGENTFYMVRRCRKMRSGAAGNFVQLLRRQDNADFSDDDGNTDMTLGSCAGDTNKLIESIIGMPYNVFIRVVVVQASLTPFFKLPVNHASAPSQTEFVENLFNLTILSEKAECLGVRIKETKQNIAAQETLQTIADDKCAEYERQMAQIERRIVEWESNRLAKIADIKEQLASIETVDFDSEKAIHAALDVMRKSRDELKSQVTAHSKTVDRLTKQISDLTKQQAQLAESTCPYCKQKYEDAKVKLVEVTAERDSIAIDLEKTESEYDTMYEQYESIQKQIAETKDKLTVEDFDTLVSIRAESGKLRQRLEDLESASNPHLDTKADFEENPPKPFDYEVLNQQKHLLKHQTMLQKLLTRKDSFVRKAFLSQNLPFLNSRLRMYLTEFGLPHKVEFTHELTADISKMGRPIGFSSLSAGQQARVNIALSLSFRDVLQRIHTPVNVAMMDEILDVGLDDVGIQSVARVLRKKARDENISMFIISHRSEIESAFDRTITIQMIDEFSYIKDDKTRSNE